MATTEEYKNGGSASYSFSIEYIKAEDIKVTVDGTSLTYTATNPPAQTTEYTVNGSNVIFKQASVSGSTNGGVRIYRETNLGNSDSVTFQAGSSIRAADLNANHKLVRFSAQEKNQEITTADIKNSAVTSAKILDGTIVNADVNASAAIAGTKISPDFGSQNIVTSGTVDGRDVSVDGTKLDGIESGATANQTNAEIKTAYEANSNTNAYTDAEKTKLSGIEASATADQTNSEIKTAYEANSNTNAYTDAEKTKLSGIEASATADQTGAEIKTAYEGESNTNAFTDAEKTKLSGISAGAEVNVNSDWNSSSGDSQILNKPTLVTAIDGLSDVDTTGVADNKILKYQASSSKFVIADDTGGGGGSSTFSGLSDTPTNYTGAAGKTVKVNAAGNGVEFVTVTTPTQDIVDDTSPQLGGNLDVQAREINTSTTNGNIKVTPNGTGLFEVKGNTNAGTLQLNCESNSHGIKLKSPPHSASASYTLTFPNNVVNGQFLKTDASGNLSWAAVDLTALSASNLTSGTIPDARFPATLPAVSGANLTNLPASSYNILINTISSYSGTGGNSASFNGSAYRFVLSNPGANAQAHLVSVNGVVQKPNSGTSQPSEGYAVDGSSIIFSSAPPSGADFFILTLGTAVTIGTPSDETVTEAKLKVSNSPTNGYYLSAQSGNSGGLTWAQVTTDLVGDTSPQLGGDLDTNGNDIVISDGEKLSLHSYADVRTKTGATNAVVSGLTGHVIQNSLVLDSDQDIWLASSGKKITFGTSDSATHEVARIQCAAVGASQHGFVNLNYVTANAGGSASSSTKLATTATGVTVTGTVAATSYTGDGSNLTGIASTVAGGAIYENSQTISASHTIPSGSNGMSAGPVTVNNGITLTISTGSTYTIV